MRMAGKNSVDHKASDLRIAPGTAKDFAMGIRVRLCLIVCSPVSCTVPAPGERTIRSKSKRSALTRLVVREES